MVNGFKNNEEMFRRTLEAFMKPYRLTIWMYVVLFAVGIAMFIVAVIVGLKDNKSVVAIVFAGLGVGAFLAFFIRQPVQALEENLEFITWLGVAFNTYWTRLMYMMDMKTIQSDLKAADEDYCTSVERLITKHSELRGKRPGGDLDSKTANDSTSKKSKSKKAT
jgi:glucan phosphoethanolaminetransferase (alkaline phosphatase superfamily)